MKLLVLGGDERSVYLAQTAKKAGWSVAARYLREWEDTEESETTWDAVALPYPVCEKDGMLAAPLWDEPVPMQAVMPACLRAQKVFGGARASLWVNDAHHPGDDESFVIQNAQITAEGALFCAMRDGKRGIRGAKCVILGCGRIARFLSHQLAALGAQVTIAARKEKDRAYIQASGWTAIDFSQAALCAALSVADFIFNTVPQPVLDETALQCIRSDAHLYELASAPYGFSMETAAQLGIHAHLESGLPGRYAPRAAAEAMFRVIERLTEEE